MRTFHINDDPSKYFISIPYLLSSTNQAVMPSILTEDYQIEERLVDETNPIKFIKAFLVTNKMEGVKPSIVLRYKDEFVDTIRIYPDSLLESYGHQLVTVNLRTTVLDTVHMALERFEINVRFLFFFC